MGHVEARGQSDRRARGERKHRLDVAGGRGTALLACGPAIQRVGDPHRFDGPEPLDQQRERVDAAVVQWPDFQKRLGAVVPVGHPAHVGVGVPQLDGSETAVGEQSARPSLTGATRRSGRTAKRQIPLAGQFEQVGGDRLVECQWLL